MGIIINGSVTLDESLGLQNTGVAVPGEDNNDKDVSLATLQAGAASFYNRLFNSTGSGGLGLATTFPTASGVAHSANDFITIPSAIVKAIGFVNGNGAALPVYSSGVDPNTGGATSISTLDGGSVHLFMDATLGNRMVLGVDTSGHIAFSLFLDPSVELASAGVWMVQFEALANPNAANPDDPVNLFDAIGVTATTGLDANIDDLPSGQNLFGIMGNTGEGMIVVAKGADLKTDGTWTNKSQTINTSQGGSHATIGVTNQMFDPGEGAYLTYVKNPDPNYLSGAPGGLSQTEADDADNILYGGGTKEVTQAGVSISQIQGNVLGTMKISAYDISGAPQGRTFVSALGSGTHIDINSVQVFNAAGADVTAGKVTLAGGIATITQLDKDFTIRWTTSAPHDQVLIEDVAGKFDIGGLTIDQTIVINQDIGQQLVFEDDGPRITASPTGAQTLTVDETVFGLDATASFAGQFTPDYGVDGPGAGVTTYALSTPGGASGLTDTLTGESVVLSKVGNDIVGQTAVSGDTVFVVSVDATGTVTLDQQRSVVHADTGNPDDATGLAGSNLVVLSATVTDGDGDSATAPLDLTALLAFEDDGPAIEASANDAPTLTVDESAYGTDATASFAGQFTPTYGADGPGAAALTYALTTPGGASGLIDTLTGESVVLSKVGNDIVGKTSGSGDTVFVVSVDATGTVTLDQQRAIEHPNPNDPDEATGLSGSNLVVLTAIATDGDGDQASAPLDLSDLLVFKDDGPAIQGTATGAPTLLVDESALGTDDTQSLAGQFTPSFGADGEGAVPIYSLATPGGDSGLKDTATGENIVLVQDGANVVGKTAISGDTVFVISVDTAGTVTLDQQRAILHSDPDNPDESTGFTGTDLVVLTATATDGDGDVATTPIDLTILFVFKDDGPSIEASAVGAPTLTVDETVFGTDATAAFAGQFTPTYGADGPGAAALAYALSTPGGASGLTDTLTGESVVLSKEGDDVVGKTAGSGDTVFVVSVDAAGNVTLDQQRSVVHADAGNPDDSTGLLGSNLVVLTATATDGDGDHAATPLDLTTLLAFEDDGPSIEASANGAPTLTVDESVFGTDDTQSFGAQFTPNFGADGAGATPTSYALSTPGGASGLTDTLTGESVVLSKVGDGIVGKTSGSGDTVFVVSVDGSGNVTLDQQRSVVHADTNDPDDSTGLVGSDLVVLTATVTDGDGDQASTPLDLTALLAFEDDGPAIEASANGAPTLTVDETVFGTDASAAFAAQFTPTYGADGAGATPTGYALSTAGGASGLTDTATGQSVVLSMDGANVVGKTSGSGDTVFIVSVNALGSVTLDQQRSVVHPDTSNPDDVVGLAGSNLVVLTASVTDGDGDHASAPLDLTALLKFEDDGPAIGPVADSIVDFVAGSSATQSLHGVIGADPNAAPYAVTAFTNSLTINGVVLHGVASNGNTTVTYYADTSGDTVFGNAGDTAYYQLDLSQSANANAGAYTFTVLVNPPPAFTEFSLSALPSGQNLFGTFGDTTNALNVIGKHPVLNADGTFTNASDTINTSQGGGTTTIGVTNQMFDAGEGAYLTYFKNPNPAYLAGAGLTGLDQTEADDADNIQYGNTFGTTRASTSISQIQGNSLATMKITAYDLAGAPQGQAFVNALGTGAHVDITTVKVLNALDQDVTAGKVTITGGVATIIDLGAGFTVEWQTSGDHDQVLIEDVAGKFDIGGFGAEEPAPTPDQSLQFTVSATDGDGDHSSDLFLVGIDGTGSYHDGQVAGVTI
jgi:hypothetical protein